MLTEAESTYLQSHARTDKHFFTAEAVLTSKLGRSFAVLLPMLQARTQPAVLPSPGQSRPLQCQLCRKHLHLQPLRKQPLTHSTSSKAAHSARFAKLRCFATPPVSSNSSVSESRNNKPQISNKSKSSAEPVYEIVFASFQNIPCFLCMPLLDC